MGTGEQRAVPVEWPPWRTLRTVALFRLFLTALMCGLRFSPLMERFLIPRDPATLAWVILTYLVIAIGLWVLARSFQRAYTTQVVAGLCIDIIATTLILHCVGGLASGVPMLMLVTVGFGGLLLSGRWAYFFAALATLALLFEHLYSSLTNVAGDRSIMQAGMFGAAYFGIAMLTSFMSRRARESEALAKRRGFDLANLSQLNELIIQRMRTGIVVVDPTEQVRLMNESAWYLMGMPSPKQKYLGRLSPELAKRLRNWRGLNETDNHPVPLGAGVPAVVPRFAPLGETEDFNTLVFLEDTSMVSRRAEEMTLASLGRLAASIAHEIRNPLGAISHAAQLLNESHDVPETDQRLIEIISNHCLRMNGIIENVLQLSRRERANPELIGLAAWLSHFVDDFKTAHDMGEDQLSARCHPTDLKVSVDPSQLQQVVWNLCQNARKYGRPKEGPATVILRAGVVQKGGGPVLDVLDNGEGIDPRDSRHIFEPFYTSSAKGTGLGLYIARQICEANQATLEYLPVPSGGSCFRITFPRPREAAS